METVSNFSFVATETTRLCVGVFFNLVSFNNNERYCCPNVVRGYRRVNVSCHNTRTSFTSLGVFLRQMLLIDVSTPFLISYIINEIPANKNHYAKEMEKFLPEGLPGTFKFCKPCFTNPSLSSTKPEGSTCLLAVRKQVYFGIKCLSRCCL